MVSVGSNRALFSEFQAVVLWQQQMYTSWDWVEAQRGNDAWQNEDVVDWPHQRLECSSPSSTGERCDDGSCAPSTRAWTSLVEEEQYITSSTTGLKSGILVVLLKIIRHNCEAVSPPGDWKLREQQGETKAGGLAPVSPWHLGLCVRHWVTLTFVLACRWAFCWAKIRSKSRLKSKSKVISLSERLRPNLRSKYRLRPKLSWTLV